MTNFAALITKISSHFKNLEPAAGDTGGIEKARSFSLQLGYVFNSPDLLIQALKHRSFLAFSNEDRLFSNERLELLGDAVLGLVVTEHLYQKYPEQEEGDLTAIKSLVVSREILAKTSRQINLGEYILMNDAEEKSGGRERTSILADTMEAIIGALYLDGGLPAARHFIANVLLLNIKKITTEEKHKNFKSLLLEYSQSKSLGLPFYVVRDEEGPDHNKLFTVEVRIQNEILGLGKGSSKKTAEQEAAQMALKKLQVI
jgi:ribonuclease-3